MAGTLVCRRHHDLHFGDAVLGAGVATNESCQESTVAPKVRLSSLAHARFIEFGGLVAHAYASRARNEMRVHNAMALACNRQSPCALL